MSRSCLVHLLIPCVQIAIESIVVSPHDSVLLDHRLQSSCNDYFILYKKIVSVHMFKDMILV